ncbi:MAG: M48 family metallopeptidase [Acidobacteriota bacterium]
MANYRFLFLIIYLLIFIFELWLKFLNLSHLKKHGGIVPPEFEGHVDSEILKKIRNYTIERSRLGFFESIFESGIFILFIFGGILDAYNSWIFSLDLPFVLSGVLFFLILSLASTFLSIPFSIFAAFRIENRYGFNTMTARLWLSDLVKSLVISIILTAAMTTTGFGIIALSPGWWWFWLWLFLLGFGIFMMYISPYAIEPLFHKFAPIQDEILEGKIRELMDKVRIRISKIRVVDASKRSRHTNAYFTGIGRVKRIVLFDTLINNMTHGEILAILAHEAGHWKKRHILKRIVLIELVSLVSLFIAFKILKGDILISLFGLESDSFFARMILLGFVGSLASFFFRPVSNHFSRRHELDADAFACAMLKQRKDLSDALVKLTKDNLSNLHPHPWYAFFYYSHPLILQRLKKIRKDF